MIASDADKNVIVSGYFSRSMSFGGPVVETIDDKRTWFLAKYSPKGEHLWSRALSPAIHNFVVATGPDGVIAIAGGIENTINLGGDDLIGDEGDVFIAQFDADGTHGWSRRFGGPEVDHASAIAIDGNGDVVVAGLFRGTVTFGGDPLTSTGEADIFLARYTGLGTHVWSKRMGGERDDSIGALAVGPDGDLAIAGGFRGVVNFGGGNVTAIVDPTPLLDRATVFVGRFSARGDHRWATALDLHSLGGVDNLAWDPRDGSLVVQSRGLSPMVIGVGTNGFYVGKLSAAGELLWVNGEHDVHGVTVGECGKIHTLSTRVSLVNFGNSTHVTELEVESLSPYGKILERTTIDGATDFYGSYINVDPSGHILVTGCHEWALSGQKDIFLAKLRSLP